LKRDGSKERNAKDYLEDLPPALVRDIFRHSGWHPSLRLAFEAKPPNVLRISRRERCTALQTSFVSVGIELAPSAFW